MARLTGALFSLAASGTIANTLTFAKWKGIQYARTRVVPANPNTAAQQEVRGVFATLTAMWTRLPSLAREPWIAAVRGLALTARNRHIQANVATLQDETDLNNLVMSVSSGAAIPLAVGTAVDGTDGTITWTATAPTAPVDYTLIDVYGYAVLDADPSPVQLLTTYKGNAGGAPWSGVIDVPTDDTYQVGLLCCWQRGADSRLFYSTAIRNQVVVTGN